MCQLSIYNSFLVIRTIIANNRHFKAFIFLFALGTPLWQSRKTLHKWKDNSVLAKPLAACTSVFNSFRVIRCLSQCVSPKIAFLPHFCFPWGRPWGNHAKCCTDGKRIWCLQIVSQHVPIYLQQFLSYSNCKCKNSPFSRTAAHIFVSPGDTLRLPRNMMHGWKDNSMLSKPIAACTHLYSIVSELYDA